VVAGFVAAAGADVVAGANALVLAALVLTALFRRSAAERSADPGRIANGNGSRPGIGNRS
jgi:hypothetical protein